MMKNTIPTKKAAESQTFHTGVKALIDRKIGGINVLNNDQILDEKSKLKNMRNGKIRP